MIIIKVSHGEMVNPLKMRFLIIVLFFFYQHYKKKNLKGKKKKKNFFDLIKKIFFSFVQFGFLCNSSCVNKFTFNFQENFSNKL